ncbi:VgrG-related protein [Novosphingobium aquimarinum]|uniref:VgrG-related protein n=1 Tax=Novosphingobium aquimarinum TaxID=2682494 RepID=UPI001E5454F2|nr:hypothetical protein [Novosphingobium aquimarinum]
MNRKPIFDCVRELLGRGFRRAEVRALDAAIDRALAEDRKTSGSGAPRLGSLSERYESGGRGPGTVSGGQGDPGGVSYGIFQLSSKAGSVAAFLASEGRRWAHELGDAIGSAAFSARWQAIAARDPVAFANAQRGFIERTHYRPAVLSVQSATGLDLDRRHAAVRDATWSTAVQHGGAKAILCDAVARADALFARGDRLYDEALVEAIYAVRTVYVERLAARANGATRQVLTNVAARRYPAERADALRMFTDHRE